MNSQTFEYSTITQSIIDYGLFINNANFRFTKQDIFNYGETPNEHLFNINFQLGQGNMEWHSAKYGINPSYYVFTNDQRVNAFAAQINGCGLVGINMGLMHHLISNFHDNTKILDLPKIQKYGETSFVADYPLNELMYQTCTLFTLYHEIGHLMQAIDPATPICQEDLSGGASFNIMQHLREHDADAYSALSIGASIWQYFDKLNENKSVTNFENLVGILSGGLLCYLFSFPSMNKPLYLNQYSHPHPIIRILNIINNISGYAVHLVKSKGVTGFEPKKENIIKIALEVGEEVAESMLPGVTFQKFVGELMLYRDSVAGYINDLNRGAEAMEGSAVRVRNGNLNNYIDIY